jgi:hypothetical protein
MSNQPNFLIFDPLIDPIEDIIKIREKALQLYAEGKTIMEYDGEGTRFQRQFVDSVSNVLAQTRNFLKQVDPQKYGYILDRVKQVRI